MRFLGLHDYRGGDGDGHHAVSLLNGVDTAIRARKVVDATYIESEVPSRHTPTFSVAPGVRLVTPNALVELGEVAAGFTVIGAGKTAMDTCNWLLDAGVDPDRIQWIRPRDPWMFRRKSFQPLQLVSSYMELQARWVEAAAEAESGSDFARRLEAADIFARIDPDVEPEAYRGPIVSDRELAGLRAIERVVRKGKVLSIEATGIALEHGHAATQPGVVHVDCTAAGVRPAVPRPVFAGERITLRYVTIVGAPWSAATLGAVDAMREDDAEKNRLCPPITFSGRVSDLLQFAYAAMSGLYARTAEADLSAWTERCRLNPARGAMARAAEPEIAAALTSMLSNFGSAMGNLARRAGDPAASGGASAGA